MDDEVVIKISSPSIGPACVESISGVSPGIDWDRGKLILKTTSPIVIKSNNESIFDASRDLLMYLATKPSKYKSYETRQAQSILKRCGYVDEDFLKYQKLFHDVKPKSIVE